MWIASNTSYFKLGRVLWYWIAPYWFPNFLSNISRCVVRRSGVRITLCDSCRTRIYQPSIIFVRDESVAVDCVRLEAQVLILASESLLCSMSTLLYKYTRYTKQCRVSSMFFMPCNKKKTCRYFEASMALKYPSKATMFTVSGKASAKRISCRIETRLSWLRWVPSLRSRVKSNAQSVCPELKSSGEVWSPSSCKNCAVPVKSEIYSGKYDFQKKSVWMPLLGFLDRPCTRRENASRSVWNWAGFCCG